MIYPSIVVQYLALEHCVILNNWYLNNQMFHWYFKSMDKFQKWFDLTTSGQLSFDDYTREACNDRFKLCGILEIKELLKA